MHRLRGYIISIIMKLTEPVFMESCESNYVPRGGKGLTVVINFMNKRWKLSILAHLSIYECYVYIFTG